MATGKSTVDYILEQLATAGTVSAKRMFGEYGVFLDGKMAALVCGDQLFVKPTAAGRAFLGAVDEAPPYPGAKACFRIAGERWDEAEWLGALIRLTAAELPAPKPRPLKAVRK